MSKLSSLLLVALMALLVSGCTKDSTPIDTIGSAFVSATKDDTSEFRSLLTGDALSQYGSEEGFEAFRHSLEGLDPETHSETLLSNLDNREVYEVTVNSSDQPSVTILTAKVICTAEKTRSCRIESIYFN